MNTILTQSNLTAGIRVIKETKPTWTNDFHDSLYARLEGLKTSGLDSSWWQEIVLVLWDWRAIRPLTRDAIRKEGLGRLGELQAAYDCILKTNAGQEPSLETASWHSLADLYRIASSIKPTKWPSPVFGSKLCHFIIPDAYPVADNEVVGASGDYFSYWEFCKSQWVACDIKPQLKQSLQQAFHISHGSRYPWSTKITELCIIGDRARGPHQRRAIIPPAPQ